MYLSPSQEHTIAYCYVSTNIHCVKQSLDSGDKDHTTSYATDPQRKALNRFKNIVVCKCQLQRVLS